MPSFTLKDVEDQRFISPKRFRFSDNPSVTHHQARGHHVVGLKFPALKRLFKLETGIDTLDGPYGPYKFLAEQSQIDAALAWQDKHRGFIFLRDNLDCSVALDFNLAAPGVYTVLGQAEHNAKASQDEASIQQLCSSCSKAIATIPFFGTCDLICAVPPSPDKAWDLPSEIAKRLAIATGKTDITPQVGFRKNKQSVKALSLQDKWKALEAADFTVSNEVKNKNVILIDDKYQSGTTAQFVACELFKAGAKEVHGLFCVKTWRDTDNT